MSNNHFHGIPSYFIKTDAEGEKAQSVCLDEQWYYPAQDLDLVPGIIKIPFVT